MHTNSTTELRQRPVSQAGDSSTQDATSPLGKLPNKVTKTANDILQSDDKRYSFGTVMKGVVLASLLVGASYLLFQQMGMPSPLETSEVNLNITPEFSEFVEPSTPWPCQWKNPYDFHRSKTYPLENGQEFSLDRGLTNCTYLKVHAAECEHPKSRAYIYGLLEDCDRTLSVCERIGGKLGLKYELPEAYRYWGNTVNPETTRGQPKYRCYRPDEALYREYRKELDEKQAPQVHALQQECLEKVPELRPVYDLCLHDPVGSTLLSTDPKIPCNHRGYYGMCHEYGMPAKPEGFDIFNATDFVHCYAGKELGNCYELHKAIDRDLQLLQRDPLTEEPSRRILGGEIIWSDGSLVSFDGKHWHVPEDPSAVDRSCTEFFGKLTHCLQVVKNSLECTPVSQRDIY